MIFAALFAMIAISTAKVSSQVPNRFDAYAYQTESECLEALEDSIWDSEDAVDACMDRIYNDELDSPVLEGAQ